RESIDPYGQTRRSLGVAADISPIAVVPLDQLSLSRHFTAPSLKLSQNTCSHKPCQYCLECIERATRASAASEIRAIRRRQRWLRRTAAEAVGIAADSGARPPTGRPAETYTDQIHVCRGDSCPYRSRTHVPAAQA